MERVWVWKQGHEGYRKAPNAQIVDYLPYQGACFVYF